MKMFNASCFIPRKTKYESWVCHRNTTYHQYNNNKKDATRLTIEFIVRRARPTDA